MILHPETINGRIDFDRVDVLGAPLQRAADIVSGTRADNHHVLERRPAGVAIENMRQRVRRVLIISRHH